MSDDEAPVHGSPYSSGTCIPQGQTSVTVGGMCRMSWDFHCPSCAFVLTVQATEKQIPSSLVDAVRHGSLIALWHVNADGSHIVERDGEPVLTLAPGEMPTNIVITQKKEKAKKAAVKTLIGRVRWWTKAARRMAWIAFGAGCGFGVSVLYAGFNGGPTPAFYVWAAALILATTGWSSANRVRKVLEKQMQEATPTPANLEMKQWGIAQALTDKDEASEILSDARIAGYNWYVEQVVRFSDMAQSLLMWHTPGASGETCQACHTHYPCETTKRIVEHAYSTHEGYDEKWCRS